MIGSLPSERSSLARATLAWCDPFWDDGRALVRAPAGSGAGRVHLVPQSAWYAYGLLLRGDDGDRTRASRCLEALLTLQYDEPGTAWHGTFARFAEAPHPPDDAVMWVHFDPNWRQFLGTTFLALLQDFEARLASPLVAGIERALRLAVEGEPEGRAPASYTNIALMKAFLAVEAGERLGEAGWVRDGEALAEEIAEGYRRFGAFEEYNSPTYYGIDFHALALWSVRASSPALRALGVELESALWRDVARWYHPGLRNLCGPYSRSYGIDMRSYVALLGLDLWAVVGPEAAPLPPLVPEAEHGHDFFLGPLVAALGRRVPADVRPTLSAFDEADGGAGRSVEQRISDDPDRVATGWLSPALMIGAERCDSDRLARWWQFVPATLHWRLANGGVGWMTVRSRSAPDARASRACLDFGWPVRDRADPGHADEIEVTVSAPGATARAFASGRWQLPGLSVRTETALPDPALERDGARFRLRYRRTAPDRPERLLLHFETT